MEFEFFQEEGSGLGPTLEYYSLLAVELKKSHFFCTTNKNDFMPNMFWEEEEGREERGVEGLEKENVRKEERRRREEEDEKKKEEDGSRRKHVRTEYEEGGRKKEEEGGGGRRKKDILEGKRTERKERRKREGREKRKKEGEGKRKREGSIMEEEGARREEVGRREEEEGGMKEEEGQMKEEGGKEGKTEEGCRNKKEQASLELFEFLGLIVGRSILDERIFDFPLSEFFWKVLFDEEIGWKDYEEVEEGVGRVMKELEDVYEEGMRREKEVKKREEEAGGVMEEETDEEEEEIREEGAKGKKGREGGGKRREGGEKKKKGKVGGLRKNKEEELGGRREEEEERRIREEEEEVIGRRKDGRRKEESGVEDEEVKSVEKEVVKSQFMLYKDNKIENLELFFNFPGHSIELMPDGSQKKVTAENLGDYLEKSWNFLISRLNKIRVAFIKGYYIFKMQIETIKTSFFLLVLPHLPLSPSSSLLLF